MALPRMATWMVCSTAPSTIPQSERQISVVTLLAVTTLRTSPTTTPSIRRRSSVHSRSMCAESLTPSAMFAISLQRQRARRDQSPRLGHEILDRDHGLLASGPLAHRHRPRRRLLLAHDEHVRPLLQLRSADLRGELLG